MKKFVDIIKYPNYEIFMEVMAVHEKYKLVVNSLLGSQYRHPQEIKSILLVGALHEKGSLGISDSIYLREFLKMMLERGWPVKRQSVSLQFANLYEREDVLKRTTPIDAIIFCYIPHSHFGRKIEENESPSPLDTCVVSPHHDDAGIWIEMVNRLGAKVVTNVRMDKFSVELPNDVVIPESWTIHSSKVFRSEYGFKRLSLAASPAWLKKLIP